MADYKEMYHSLLRATEKAIKELIEAQKICEDIYIEKEEALHEIEKA